MSKFITQFISFSVSRFISAAPQQVLKLTTIHLLASFYEIPFVIISFIAIVQ